MIMMNGSSSRCYNKVEILKNGLSVLSYEDIWINKDKFQRIIGSNTYYFTREGKVLLFSSNKPTRFIKGKKLSQKIDTKIRTLDIETYVDLEGKQIPYLIAYYDGAASCSYTFYSTDYNSPDDMIKACVTSLFVPKYHKHKIYIHNLANFDGIFLLRNLVTFGNLNVLLNQGKLISIELKTFTKDNTEDNTSLEEEKIEICFRDSYKILLAGLKKLGKSFKVQDQKTIFPYKFVNDHDLDYIGKIPSFEYFDNITQDEYDKYLDNKYTGCSESYTKETYELSYSWNLREEAIEYCINDCVSLHQIMVKFNEMFYDKFNICVNEHPTLPGLAFRLFRSRYLKQTKIPMIYGENYKRLKQSYTGGAVDMYIPQNNLSEVELVYAYDVNSLYPFIMANYPMPIGEITYFEGDIRKINPEAFGFFYCRIQVPLDLKHPILQTHVQTKGGLRTLAGVGSYHDMIFSHSYDTAIKAGYKIDILWGYTFEKGFIFKEYVEDLYKMRLQYDKTDPMNYIAKINLNSLYGKFGMRDDFDQTFIVNQDKFEEINNTQQPVIKDIIKLDDHYLIQLPNEDKGVSEELVTSEFNINVAIASAITSYARDYMSQFKNNDKLKLFYSDTDSIYTNLSPYEMEKLFPNMISSKGLGLLKHEGTYKRAIFLAPKCYCLEDEQGKLSYKVKGLMKDVSLKFDDFKSLLIKDSVLDTKQTKWFKNLSSGSINVLEQSYTLRQTDNKRELIFDNSNEAISSKPYFIYESELISSVNENKTWFIQNKFIKKSLDVTYTST